MAELKDSGNRRQFNSGAVRDMQEGKGRMDLVPWGICLDMYRKMLDLVNVNCGLVPKKKYLIPGGLTSVVARIFDIASQMDELFNDEPNISDAECYGEIMYNFETIGAMFMLGYYYHGHLATDGVHPDAILARQEFVHVSFAEAMLETAKHFEDGARKYEPNNWRRGMPIGVYFDSAMRHFMKLMAGWNDEPHDRAFLWNCICGAWQAQTMAKTAQKYENEAKPANDEDEPQKENTDSRNDSIMGQNEDVQEPFKPQFEGDWAIG